MGWFNKTANTTSVTSTVNSTPVQDSTAANYGGAGSSTATTIAPISITGDNNNVTSSNTSSSTSNYTTTDFGSVKAGVDLSKQALATSGAAFKDAIEALGKNTDKAMSQIGSLSSGVIDKSLSIASRNQTSESSQVIDMVKQIGIGVVVAVAVWLVTKGKGN